VKIVRVACTDLKGCKFIELVPKDTVTVIGGRNGQGKSSLLDAVAMALGGKKLCPEKPIRKGCSKGSVEVSLDGDPAKLFPACTVRRDFWLKKDGKTVESKLEIVTREGYRAPSPQALLGDIVGPLGFDPESFLRMTGKEQADVLRSLVGLDFSKLDAEAADIYRERARVNDTGKRLRITYDAMPHHVDAPDAEVSVAKLVDELRARKETNNQHRKVHNSLADMESERDDALRNVETCAQRVVELEQQLAAAQENFTNAQTAANVSCAQCDSMAAHVLTLQDADIDEVEQQIANSESINKQVRKNAKRAELAATLEAERAKSKALTDKLTSIEEQKDELRKSAKWPVDGLGYDDNGVTYQDLPFEQVSASEQRRVAVGIACTLQPTLRFMFIKDGSLLDDESKADFASIAAEHGIQLFMEVVGDADSCNIVIEAGEVSRADEGMLVAAPSEELPEEPMGA
jgi:DNA repair exonuclease SbcCD ATPase subunit